MLLPGQSSHMEHDHVQERAAPMGPILAAFVQRKPKSPNAGSSPSESQSLPCHHWYRCYYCHSCAGLTLPGQLNPRGSAVSCRELRQLLAGPLDLKSLLRNQLADGGCLGLSGCGCSCPRHLAPLVGRLLEAAAPCWDLARTSLGVCSSAREEGLVPPGEGRAEPPLLPAGSGVPGDL